MEHTKRIGWLFSLLLFPIVAFSAGSITSVKVLKITPGPLNTEISYTGYLAPEQRVNIRTQAEGTVEKVMFKKGDQIEKGQILLHISTETLALDAQKAKLNFQLAKANYDAEKKSLNQKIVWRKLLITVKAAKANLNQAISDVVAAQQIADSDIGKKQLALRQKQASYNFALAKTEFEKERQLLNKKMSSQSKLDTYKNRMDTQQINMALVALEVKTGEIKSDREQLETANRNLTLRQLEYQQTQIDLEDYDNKTDQYRLEALRNTKEIARIHWKSAKIELAKSKVKAPFSGIISSKNVEQGGYVQKGEAVLELMDIDNVLAKVNIPEAQIKSLKVGKKARISFDALPKMSFGGVVHTIGLEADLKSRSFPIEVKIANSDQKLLPGMMSRIQIQLKQLQEQIMVPSHAVIEKEFNRVVYIEENGFAVEKIVQTGAIVQDRVQIIKGLLPKEKLIVSGHRFLANKDSVLVIQ